MIKRTATSNTPGTAGAKTPEAGILTLPDLWHLVIASTLLFLPTMIMAQQLQSLESIREAAQLYAVKHLTGGDEGASVEISRLDSRLRLQRCDQPLEAFQPPGQGHGGRTSIGVRCVGETQWTIYMSASVRRQIQVYIAARSLARGTRLGEKDVQSVTMDTGNVPHGYFTEVDEVLGMELRRPSRPGEVLTPMMLAPPRLVQRGQSVLVQAESGSTRVSMRGEALEDGIRGQRIRVRNSRSDRIVEGTVIGEGRIRVNM